MILDFKNESISFAREHGCPPAFIIQAAMERGAEMALDMTFKRIRAEKIRRQKLNQTGLKDGEKTETDYEKTNHNGAH